METWSAGGKRSPVEVRAIGPSIAADELHCRHGRNPGTRPRKQEGTDLSAELARSPNRRSADRAESAEVHASTGITLLVFCAMSAISVPEGTPAMLTAATFGGAPEMKLPSRIRKLQ